MLGSESRHGVHAQQSSRLTADAPFPPDEKKAIPRIRGGGGSVACREKHWPTCIHTYMRIHMYAIMGGEEKRKKNMWSVCVEMKQ